MFVLQARCGIVANLFEGIVSMISGMQKGKGMIRELCKSSLCLWFNTVFNLDCFRKALKNL